MTTTAILGLGNMGKGLAKRLAGKTELVLGASNPAAATEFAASVGATVTDYKSAVLAADIVVLALPYGAALELAGKLPLNGKIVVDISNPVKADFSGLAIGHTTSAAEELQAAAPSAKVVKGYNTIFASLFDTPASATANVPVFLAGNDAAAVDAVAELVTASGFAVEKVGGLDGARLVEPVGMLNIRFGYGLGQGTAIAPTWLKLAA
ncbi:oxidoreductase [Devosia sp. Root413D1]|uniref:NADPH-dependent F420 reductase n=1 Tax=unclassified Devosia TaxID=196773 RepID=UPI0006FB39E0|nr:MULTISPECIES: NAD(P)-binding domain-containing protein [unclassified Devosia]KQV08809.1 oxidoreductase [Devosia sp. Root105]KQW79027.1 oxidoreductase [Devosia sp. Root413D1]